MQFTVPEMNVVCAFHAGTLSATLGLLQEAERIGKEPPDRMAAIKSAAEKLSALKSGDMVSLAFEPEK